MLLGDWLVSIDWFELGENVGNYLVFSDGKVIIKTLGALCVISLSTYGGTVLRSLEASTIGIY